MKKILKLVWNSLKDFFIYRLFYPTHLRVLINDLLNYRQPISDNNKRYIHALTNWLLASQDVHSDGGSSTRYYFSVGWSSSYPETSGYIIPTLMQIAQKSGIQEYRNRALRMADWLLGIQNEQGYWTANKGKSDYPKVFNTGQILLGLSSAFEESKNPKYLSAAAKAANWISDLQESDGSWIRFAHESIPHTYYTSVAWPLLQVGKILKNDKLIHSAIKNFNWAVKQQLENGWFENNSFFISQHEKPLTHTIAYSIMGLLEGGILLESAGEKFIYSARLAAEALMKIYETRKKFPAYLNRKWEPKANFECLTGNAQIAIIFQKIYKLNGDIRFFNTALKINDQLKALIYTDIKTKGICGGLKGSHPIWGHYCKYSYPNWAAKFCLDSFLLENEIKSELENKL